MRGRCNFDCDFDSHLATPSALHRIFHRVEGVDGLVVTAVVNPYERKAVATLAVVNPRAGCSIAAKYSWKEGPPDPSILRKIASDDEATILAQLYAAKRLKLDADSLTISQLTALCTVPRFLLQLWHCFQHRMHSSVVNMRLQANAVQFVDAEFPPLQTSLYRTTGDDDEKKDGDVGVIAPSSVPPDVITWRRVSQFLRPAYQVVADGVSPLDIRQGSLGDCWCVNFRDAVMGYLEMSPL